MTTSVPRPLGSSTPTSLDRARIEAVICIPTFRRPQRLAATLASIEAQNTDVVFAVVVVDNDASGREGFDVATVTLGRGPLQGLVAVEERQGNVHAINAAFRIARESYPATNLFLMIDDDEIASPMWIDEMVRAVRHENVDIVGGPVFPVFPPEAKAAFREHPAFWPSIRQSGIVPMIYGTGNCLITRRVFEGLESPSLDPRFNFLGGGDTEFFTRCRMAGFTFYWTQEARISEPIAPERLLRTWVLRRGIATGVINYRIDRLAARSLADRARLMAKNGAVALVSIPRALSLLSATKHPLAALHPVAVAIGRWLASIGLDPQPYRAPTS